MPPVGFEPTIPAGERPQTYALDLAAIGTGKCYELEQSKSVITEPNCRNRTIYIKDQINSRRNAVRVYMR